MIIVNDNGRSYAPTIGGLGGPSLDALRTSARYEKGPGVGQTAICQPRYGTRGLRRAARPEVGHQGRAGCPRSCSRTWVQYIGAP